MQLRKSKHEPDIYFSFDNLSLNKPQKPKNRLTRDSDFLHILLKIEARQRLVKHLPRWGSRVVSRPHTNRMRYASQGRQ